MLVTVAVLAAVTVALAGLGLYFLHDSKSAWNGRDASIATFVGSETCAGCHRAQAELWHTSQHKHAMDHATDKTVLGDFSDATFDYFWVKSRFFRKDGKFFVETDGPDGKLAVFEVKYTFGVDPLQQYLVEFPDGRLQALSLAWDSRPEQQGGQRWFHLYPNEEIKHDDVLHWTKLNQNWNFMCAECHSTGVHKNYNAASDSFATTWDEISVGCETCHGHGSRHVAWANEQNSWLPFGKSKDRTKGLIVRFDERADVTWRRDTTGGNPQRSFPRRFSARKSRPAAYATRAEANSLKNGCPEGRFRTPTSSPRSPAVCMSRTGRCETRFTTTAHSNKAKCLRPE